VQERWARSHAQATRDEAGLKLVDEAARLPVTSPKRMAAPRKWVMSDSDHEYLKVADAFMGTPEHHSAAAAIWVRGYQFEAN